jgi:peptidyl-prolyl cis-trans isomerase D
MIGFFRRVMSSWIVLGLLGLVLIAFIVTGVGDPFGGMGGGGGSQLAKVGGTSISDTQIRQQLDRAVRNARQQDPQVDTATYVRAGGFDQILSQSIIAEAISQWAKDQGFAVSRRQVDGEIASIPAFQLAGRFDQATYEAALQQQRISDRELRAGLTSDLLRKQVLLPVSTSASVTEGLVKPYAELLLEERKGTIGIVPSQLFADKAPPSDADVEAFYKKNGQRYMVPERRVIRYALITPEMLGAGTVPTEAEIQKFYSDNQASYGPSEKRTLSQIILPDAAAAKQVADRAAKGENFATIAAEKGFAPSDIAIGEQTRASLVSASNQAVADAAFAAPAGGTTAPVQSDYGWHVVHVDKIAATPGRALEQVRGEIAEKLAGHKREEAMADLVARVEDSLSNGDGMADVVKANNLTEASTPPVTANGASPDNPDFTLPPLFQPIVKAAFTLTPDDDPVVEELGQHSYAIVALGDVTEAAPRPLARIKDQVTGDLVRSRAFEKAKKEATLIIAKVKGGETLPKALAGAKLPAPQTASNRRIDLASQGERVPPPLAIMFTMPLNGVKMLPAPNEQGWFIVKVDEVKKGDLSTAPALLESTRAQFNQFASDEYAAQFARAVAAEVGMKRNDKAIARLKRELTDGAAGDQ